MASRAERGESRADDAAVVAVSATEVEELRSAVVRLASHVTSLSNALTAVNEIQLRQTETERKTAVIQKEAVEAKKIAVQLANTTVSKEEIQKAHSEQNLARHQTLHRIYLITAGLLLVMGATAFGVVLFQKSQQSAVYRVCVQRNVQNAAVSEVLTHREPGAPPLTASQQKNLQTLRDAFKVVDCNQLR